jgi:hypothetical protein
VSASVDAEHSCGAALTSLFVYGAWDVNIIRSIVYMTLALLNFHKHNIKISIAAYTDTRASSPSELGAMGGPAVFRSCSDASQFTFRWNVSTQS